MNTNRSFLNTRIDWLTILLWFSLCIIGWFNIHAAVYDPEHSSLISIGTNYGKQFIFIVTATIIGATILIIDNRFYSSIAPVFYGVTILLLILVLIVGRNVGGNQAWIPIGSFRLQPSEFAKLSCILLLAKFLNAQSNKMPNTRNLFYGALIIFVPVFLIMLQPDWGSAVTFTALVFVFYREGYLSGNFLLLGMLSIVLFILTLLFPEGYIILFLALISLIIGFLYRKSRKKILASIIFFVAASVFTLGVDFAFNNVLQSHHRNRIEVMLGKIDDPLGEGYNVNQSKIAIGSGQFFGKGYLQGTQTKYNFVPEQSTDFIFCTIGEEWGFVGSITLVILYLTLLLRIIFLAERQRTTFSRVYAYGVASILFFHFFLNIGMTLGIVPVIGIPLPFISYGGSSLWSFTILLFILIKLDASRKGLSSQSSF